MRKQPMTMTGRRLTADKETKSNILCELLNGGSYKEYMLDRSNLVKRSVINELPDTNLKINNNTNGKKNI